MEHSSRRLRNLCNRMTMTIRDKTHRLLEVESRLSGLSVHKRREPHLANRKNNLPRKWEAAHKI